MWWRPGEEAPHPPSASRAVGASFPQSAGLRSANRVSVCASRVPPQDTAGLGAADLAEPTWTPDPRRQRPGRVWL